MAKTVKLKEQFQKELKTADQLLYNKVNNWLTNEQLFNGVVQESVLTRANFHVPKVFEGVNTISARLGNVPDIDYDTKPEGDDNASDIMKALWQYDVRLANLAYLYMLSKTEVGLYGRTVFELIPKNDGVGFELIDTMGFRIAPGPLGIDSATAQYCGKKFIYKSIDQIETEADSMGYDPQAVKKVKKIKQDTLDQTSQDASRVNDRLSSLGFTNVNQLGKDMVHLNVWYTRVGKEMHTQTWAIGAEPIMLRDLKIEEVGLKDKKWPFESYAMYPRAISFWVPGTADILRDPNLALDLNLNQTFDNNTYKNFSMIFAKSGAGLPSSIVPRPLGVIKVTTPQNESIQDQVWAWQPGDLPEAQATYQMINTIAESASGMNTGTPGQRGKKPVSQLAKEQALMDQIVGQMKMSVLLCFERLSQRYADLTKANLTVPRKVKIFGQKQMTLEGVTKDNFAQVEFISHASSAETAQENKAMKQKAQFELYDLWKDDPQVNQLELKRWVAKGNDVSASEQEKLFTPDPAQMGAQPQPGQPQPGQPQPGQPKPGAGIPQNAENPQLSQIGQMAQAAVPNQLRP